MKTPHVPFSAQPVGKTANAATASGRRRPLNRPSDAPWPASAGPDARGCRLGESGTKFRLYPRAKASPWVDLVSTAGGSLIGYRGLFLPSPGVVWLAPDHSLPRPCSGWPDPGFCPTFLPI